MCPYDNQKTNIFPHCLHSYFYKSLLYNWKEIAPYCHGQSFHKYLLHLKHIYYTILSKGYSYWSMLFPLHSSKKKHLLHFFLDTAATLINWNDISKHEWQLPDHLRDSESFVVLHIVHIFYSYPLYSP